MLMLETFVTYGLSPQTNAFPFSIVSKVCDISFQHIPLLIIGSFHVKSMQNKVDTTKIYRKVPSECPHSCNHTPPEFLRLDCIPSACAMQVPLPCIHPTPPPPVCFIF